MKKSSKRLVISTEAKNNHGFKTRTAGISLANFEKNPLLLWMHKRPTGESKDEILPLGYWEDIKLENDVLSGVPVFDDKDPFAMAIYNKVENGTIKMASAGLNPIEFKEEGDDLWLWLSSLFEASLCDIGSNPEALAVSLYGENYEAVTLSDVYKKVNTNKNDKNMKIKLTATAAKILGLAEGNEVDGQEAFANLVTLASENAIKLAASETARLDAEQKLKDAQTLQLASEKNALLDVAEKVDYKITADERPFLLKMETEDLKVYLSKRPTSKPVKDQINNGDEGADDVLLKLSYKELDKKGLLLKLKTANPEAFKEKYKAHFGTEYTG